MVFPERPLERRMFLGFGVTLSLLILISMTIYQAALAFIAADQRVVHTREVQQELQALLSRVQDAETAQRGFLLTGSEAYLLPYEKALPVLPYHLKRLQLLTADSPQQQRQLPALQASILQKLAELKQTVDLKRAGREQAARQLVQAGRGKRDMDVIRQQIAAMAAMEEQLLKRRSATARSDARTLLFILAGILLLLFALVLLLFILLRRYLTERYKAEVTLRAGEERYAGMVANTPGMIYRMLRHRAEGASEFLYVSEGSRTLFGIAPDQIISDPLTLRRMVHPDEDQEYERVAMLANARIQPWRWKGRFVLPSGEIKFIQGLGRPELQMNGDLLWDGLMMDVTENVQAEHKAAQLAAIVEGSVDAINSQTLDGLVTSWNKAAEQMYGYTAEEMIGQPIARLLPEDRPHEVEELLKRIMCGESIQSYETVRKARDGTLLDITLTMSPIKDSSGKIAEAASIAQDIRHRKEIARALQERVTEIELLNNRLNRSIRETHHRVKNNLQVISAMLDMQAMQYEVSVPVHEVIRLRQHIKALATIHDMLTHQAKGDTEVYAVSVQSVLQRLMPMLQALVDTRPMELFVQDISLPVRQVTTLIVVLNELISNAIKHGKGKIGARFAIENETIVLEVTDDGPGFAEGFEPLKAANTGIDLIESLTRYDLAGTVEYTNRPEGGGRVCIRFPLINAIRTAGEQ